MSAEGTLARSRAYVETWRPRLGISEVVNVEIIEDDGQTERELEARCVPIERDATGLWVFTMSVVAAEPPDPEHEERVVVHELVHVLLEPLRETYLGAKAVWLITTKDPGRITADQAKVGDYSGKLIVMPLESEMKQVIPPPALETWETVVDRIADAFLHAYSEKPRRGHQHYVPAAVLRDGDVGPRATSEPISPDL